MTKDHFPGASDPLLIGRRRFVAGAAALTAANALSTPVFAKPIPQLSAVRQAAIADQANAIRRLQEWIALPTITAEELNIVEGPAYMAKIARDAGFTTAEIIPTAGTAGVFATLDVGAPRWVAFYFMYDVKQFDQSEWSSPPLEGRLVDKPSIGKVIMGRGAFNQKGPNSALLDALRAMRAAGQKPPVNIALICEGEEEIASPHFMEIATHPSVLPILKKCVGLCYPHPLQDVATGQVNFSLGCKGALEFHLTVDGGKSGTGPSHDIHSSEKGRVDSPIMRLIQAVASLTSADGNTPVMDGYMDKVRPFTAHEHALIRGVAASTDEARIKAALGVRHWIDNMDYTASIERLLGLPTINVQGFTGGYTGPGGKTVLPAKAEIKLDIRMVPNQTFDETVQQLRSHLDKRGFSDVELHVTGGYDPAEVSESALIVKAALAAFRSLNSPVVLSPRIAGCWPASTFTKPPIGIPPIMFGLGYGTAAHAPDEFYVVESANPKLGGMVDAAMAQVEFLHAVANA